MQSPSPQQVHIDKPMGEEKRKKKKKIFDGLSISVKQLSEYILLGENIIRTVTKYGKVSANRMGNFVRSKRDHDLIALQRQFDGARKSGEMSRGKKSKYRRMIGLIKAGECMMAEDSQIPSYSNTNLRQEAINKKKLKPFDNSPRAGISKKYIQAYGNMPVDKAPIEARRFLGVGNQNR